jgi:hypothetical protein
VAEATGKGCEEGKDPKLEEDVGLLLSEEEEDEEDEECCR